MSTPIVERLTTLGLIDWGEPHHLTGGEVSALCSAAPQDGLVCLLGAAIDLGRVEVDEQSRSLVVEAWTELMARAVQLDELLLPVVDVLERSEIDHRVLKGAAVASLDEIDPAWRSYGDVDVLVPAHRLLAAADSLASLDLHPVAEPVSRRWAGRYAKSMTLVHPSGAQVDLHRILAAGPFVSRLRAACLFEQGRPFRVGDRELMALSDVHRLLHACYHATLGGSRGARHRRDILLLAHRVSPSALTAELADGWSPAVVSDALRWAGEPALPDGWVGWLRDVRLEPADEELIRVYSGSFRDVAFAELRELRGVTSRARYAGALLWPSRANLAARGRRRISHLRDLTSRGRQARTARDHP